MRSIFLVLLLAATTAAALPAQASSHPPRIPGPAPAPAWMAPARVESTLPDPRRTTPSRWAEGAWIGGILSSLSSILILRQDPCGVLGTPDRACDLGTAMGGLFLQALPGAIIGGLIGDAISGS